MGDISTGEGLRAAREGRAWSRPDLARRLREASEGELPATASLVDMIKQWEAGKHSAGRRYRSLLERVFRAPGEHLVPDDEVEALALVRRVAASDVGDETLSRLEAVFEELAVAYSRTSPGVLLARLRRHLGYVRGCWTGG